MTEVIVPDWVVILAFVLCVAAVIIGSVGLAEAYKNETTQTFEDLQVTGPFEITGFLKSGGVVSTRALVLDPNVTAGLKTLTVNNSNQLFFSDQVLVGNLVDTLYLRDGSLGMTGSLDMDGFKIKNVSNITPSAALAINNNANDVVIGSTNSISTTTVLGKFSTTLAFADWFFQLTAPTISPGDSTIVPTSSVLTGPGGAPVGVTNIGGGFFRYSQAQPRTLVITALITVVYTDANPITLSLYVAKNFETPQSDRNQASKYLQNYFVFQTLTVTETLPMVQNDIFSLRTNSNAGVPRVGQIQNTTITVRARPN